MAYFTNCNTASLAPYTTPLDMQRVQHVFRRLGFSAPVAVVRDLVGENATVLIDRLVDEALSMPITPAPEWANWTNANYPEQGGERRRLRNEQADAFRVVYTNNLLDNTLRERLSFFWSNHFVTELDIYNCNAFLYSYVTCLQRNATGNFKTFVSEIGLESAMLFYLDGVFNNGNNPNENYARELYELFTLGEGNGYTEEDIVETAKALTGYVDRGEVGCSMVQFRANRHDDGVKTILGQTGNWGYEDVIDILFEQRGAQVAEFICRKLYTFFVHPDATDATSSAATIISGMAATMQNANFEIAPVLRELFRSEHFFDDEAIGVLIKSPFDLYLNFLKESTIPYTDTHLEEINNYSGLLSQTLFDPYDVAGWQRNRSWINNNFLIGRWLTLESMLTQFYEQNSAVFREFAMEVTGDLALTTYNPDLIARELINFMLPKGLLNEGEYAKAFAIFRSDVEEVYFEGGNQESWTLYGWPRAPFQVYLLLQHIVRQPEFQLK